MKIIEKYVDVQTGEETITERDETVAEQSARETLEAKQLAEQTETETKATAKAVLLDRLGITEEEAQLLLGGN
jgi:hypothetical protein